MVDPVIICYFNNLFLSTISFIYAYTICSILWLVLNSFKNIDLFCYPIYFDLPMSYNTLKDRNGNKSLLRLFFALFFTFNVEWHGCIISYFVILFLYVLIFYARLLHILCWKKNYLPYKTLVHSTYEPY